MSHTAPPVPQSTRAIFITRAGPVDLAFDIRNRPTEHPGKGEVLISVRAAGVNFADVLARQELYPETPKRPCVVSYEVSGVVLAIGEEVSPDWLGKSVIALTDFGGYAETVRVDQHRIWETPALLSFEQATAIPLNYITTWGLLRVMGGLAPSETVLIHNVGGGVGLAALDIARHIGARVLGTASPRKHVFLAERGLDHAIDYRRDDWTQQVFRLTNGKGVELVIDPIGGKQWKKSFSVLGLIRMFLAAPRYHVGNLLPSNRGVLGLNIHSMFHEWEKLNEWMQAILAGVTEGWITPHVDKPFAFNEVAEAHRHLEARGNIGKVVLLP